MTWNATQLQERFALRDRTLESQIPQLRRNALQNDNYKRIHDKQLGAQQVFIILSTSAALSSRDALLTALRSMREDGPVQVTGAFDARLVKPGWDDALDALLSNFSHQ